MGTHKDDEGQRISWTTPEDLWALARHEAALVGGRAILTLLRIAAMHAGQHRYLSTTCLHGNHEACRLTCKTCAAPCLCDCHAPDAR